MKSLQGSRYHRIPLFILFGGLALIGLGVVAHTRANKLQDTARTQWQSRLVASLGPTQEFLATWIEDRFADAHEAARMVTDSEVIYSSGMRPNTSFDTTTRARQIDALAQRIAARMHRSGFLGVWLIDTSGTVVASSVSTAPLSSEITAARTTGRTFTEVVTGPITDATGRARVAVITPVPTRHLALVLVHDAGQTLFSFVNREGGNERTIRTKFIAADTAGIRILSPSAYPTSEALGRIVARSAAPTAWLRAINGVDTTGTFIGLNGQSIIAATTFVSSTKWGLVRAIDEDEALTLAHERFQAECGVVLSLLAACAAICGAMYNNARKQHRVEALARHAKDSADAHQRMREMNDEMERQVTLRTSELRAALEAAELANRTKSEFLARMSHELRTPLNSVIGFANILMKNKGGNQRPQDLVYLDRIGANGTHLLELISSILDLAKIESGHMEAEMTDIHLGHLVTGVIEQLAGVLRDRPVTLSADLPAHITLIRSDEVKLRQILVNLVGNAAKFTESGHILVRIVTNPATGCPRRIEVHDTGIGIPADRLQAIFKAFEQVDNSTARRYGGTGLGLAITWALCDLLGAHLTVDSAVGLGSTFSVHLYDDVEYRAIAGSKQNLTPTLEQSFDQRSVEEQIPAIYHSLSPDP